MKEKSATVPGLAAVEQNDLVVGEVEGLHVTNSISGSRAHSGEGT